MHVFPLLNRNSSIQRRIEPLWNEMSAAVMSLLVKCKLNMEGTRFQIASLESMHYGPLKSRSSS